jgi:hypothetical protein
MLRNCIRSAVGAVALMVCAPPPLQGSASLVLSPDGLTVYDSVNGVTWLANANLPATSRFGLSVCAGAGPQPCVNANGSMNYNAAAWVAAMNAANYLGHSNWQLPATPVAPGEFQFNVVVPASLGNGDQTIAETYKGLSTQAGSLITVQK